MPFPPLRTFKDEQEYESYYITKYCLRPIVTFDNIPVYFHKRDFQHIFFESVKSKDDTFSTDRAERIDWIEYTLKDPNAKLRVGWIGKKKTYDRSRRVAIIAGDYVVIILLNKTQTRANILTAYVADNSIAKILGSPVW
ncbi:MAG: hypothetical protein K9M99_10370 [Candidatus Cloacimonetes bacterium]|nr:hypothetical protein [Candidatus Cloacimonadota bacterium]